LAICYVVCGFGIAYALLHDDDAHALRTKVQQTTTDNLQLQKKLIAAEQALQVELATSNHLAQTLSAQQDENIKLKEELMFYKNMTKH
jgi:cell shape-determining protein MreC